MRLEFDYPIPFSAEVAWEKQSYVTFLISTSKPIVGMRVIGPSPSRFEPGQTYVLKIKLFGVLPWSTHTIFMKKHDATTFSFETQEKGGAIKSWVHQHHLVPIDDHSCRGRDLIVFHAGILSPFVWLMSQWMYRVRHNAWIKVARSTDS